MRFLTWLKINISSEALLDKICKRVVWNEVMETYLIQQAHVGKLQFANINTELHSLAWVMSAELSRVVQRAVASAQLLETEELRASDCPNPPLWICCLLCASSLPPFKNQIPLKQPSRCCCLKTISKPEPFSQSPSPWASNTVRLKKYRDAETLGNFDSESLGT